jgi:hypothetical protein
VTSHRVFWIVSTFISPAVKIIASAEALTPAYMALFRF